VLLSAALLLLHGPLLGTSFYLSDIHIAGEALDHVGGSPILFQHLFWFLGHPEVYIVMLPAFGITSEIISTNARKPIFGYRAMIGSILAIGFLSFIVWGHHMFVTGMNPFLGSVFVFTTLLIAIPSAVKVFNYITTLWRGNIVFTPAMLFSIGLVATFIAGGLTGIILADSALDINVHDTYFVIAHFHIVMGMSAIFGMFAGIYHWFPKMYGKMMNTKLGYAHFWITFVCAFGVFFPMHFIGLAGAPRRYYSYSEFPMFDGVVDLNVLVTMFAIIGALAQGDLHLQLLLQRVPWSESRAEPLEEQHPGVDHTRGASPWQLAGSAAGGVPLALRLQQAGQAEDWVSQITPLEHGEEEH
jgi:cytochrome c oxidase subunit 1